MLIRTVLADAFATKCRLLATGRGTECVVVDPGLGVAAKLPAALDADGLRPVAVLLTHGHLDHTLSVAEICAAHRIPVYLHSADHMMLTDPIPWLGSEFGPQFEEILGPRWRWNEPDNVRALAHGTVLELAGLRLTVDHTPGHTPGSVMYNLPGDASAAAYCMVGDVLYAGSIGRTDMPGGSRAQTLASLKGVLAKRDTTVLLTGHGDDTTLATERTGNPFMRQAADWTPAPARPAPLDLKSR